MTSNFMWVLLAAGASTRLGQPKQLLTLGGTTLVYHQVQSLLATQHPVCVISGAIDLSTQLPEHERLTLMHNPNWQQGIGTSITLALSTFPSYHLGWVLVDQYRICTEKLVAFHEHWQCHEPPVQVSVYQASKKNAWGAPVIMHQSICQGFRQSTIVRQADKAQGLKPWLEANQEHIDISSMPWPEAEQDIDTIKQWKKVNYQPNWGTLA